MPVQDPNTLAADASVLGVKVIPFTSKEIEALASTLTRLIESGGSVDELRALINVHDMLRRRVQVFNTYSKAAQDSADKAIEQARQEGKTSPQWHGEWAQNEVLGGLIRAWLDCPDFPDANRG